MLTRVLQMATKPKITLFVDTVSPFAYAAYHILRVLFPPSPSIISYLILFSC